MPGSGFHTVLIPFSEYLKLDSLSVRLARTVQFLDLGGQTGRIMLNNISRQIRDCLSRAEESEGRALKETDPELRQSFLDIARRWRVLARSYEFAEQLERFTYKPTRADRHKT